MKLAGTPSWTRKRFPTPLYNNAHKVITCAILSSSPASMSRSLRFDGRYLRHLIVDRRKERRDALTHLESRENTTVRLQFHDPVSIEPWESEHTQAELLTHCIIASCVLKDALTRAPRCKVFLIMGSCRRPLSDATGSSSCGCDRSCGP